MRWGMAATAGSILTFHIDSHGRATYISFVDKDGLRLWVLAGTKDNVYQPSSTSTILPMHDKNMCHASFFLEVGC